MNGWDVEIKVNGTTLTIPKEIIEDNYILVSKGDRHMFLFKKPMMIYNLETKTFRRIYDQNATVLIVSGISYLVIFCTNNLDNYESKYTLDYIEEADDKDVSQNYVDFIYIDNAFEFSPSRSVSELLDQLMDKKEIISDMIRNGVNELKKYYLSKLNLKKVNAKEHFEYIKDDCVVYGAEPGFVRVPYFIGSGDFPVKPAQSQAEIFDLSELWKKNGYVYLNTFPVPRFIKKKYFVELTTNSTFSDHLDTYNIHSFISSNITYYKIIADGLIFSANKGSISERTVEIIPLSVQASFGRMISIVNGALSLLEIYVPPIKEIPDKVQGAQLTGEKHAVAVSNMSLERRVTRVRQEHLPILDIASPVPAVSAPVRRKRESRFSDPWLVQTKLFQ